MQLKKSHALAFAFALALGACSGSSGNQGPKGDAGAKGDTGSTGDTGTKGDTGSKGDTGAAGKDLTAVAKLESCVVCHTDAAAGHQTRYNAVFDTSKLVASIDSVVSAPRGTTPETYEITVTFGLTKNGVAYSASIAGFAQKTVYATRYNPATRTFDPTVQLTTLAAVAGQPGKYTAKNDSTTPIRTASFAPESSNAQVYAYFAENVTVLPNKGNYRYYDDVASVAKAYGTLDFVSAANVEGCQRCHPTPYMKHGYRAGRVAGIPDMAACKACHYDTRAGGHQAWALLADDPAAYAAQNGATTAEQNTRYAYIANTMNDTHMSHAMEFAYPQSMANCVTCHAGKLQTLVLTDANFNLRTCKSCHPVTGPEAKYVDAKRAPSLNSLLKAAPLDMIHVWDLQTATVACNECHKTGGVARTFSQIHSGYDTLIYPAADGKKYADYFKVAVSEASFDAATSVLTMKFTGTETGDLVGYAVDNIVPTVLVGLYGYDSKDFIVSAHGRDDGVNRNLEWVYGATHKRFAGSYAAGVWTVTANLSDYKGLIDAGKVKRAELAIMPKLVVNGATVALDAPTKTFNLKTNAFEPAFFGSDGDKTKAIVNPDKCNACHDALATTFHSGDRGGSVVNCRICHTTREGGGHLEMQSRSIDSYVHAIHSFQVFDIRNVDFADKVQALRYDHHVESTYPNFTILNCESCHNPGKYGVPDQAKSMPGVLSASSVTKNWDREVGTYPSYVTGPASRACGACHRAEKINDDFSSELSSFMAHTGAFSTQLVSGTGVFDAAIEKIFAEFK